MRFLIVSYAYPPLLSPRAFRWGAIARQLASHGHQVDVVCGWQPGLAHRQTGGPSHADRPGTAQRESTHVSGMAYQTEPGAAGSITVHRVAATWFEALRGRLGGGELTEQGARKPRSAATNHPSRPARLARLASWAYYTLWRNIYWPDSYCLFVMPALGAVRGLLRQNRYDALITVSLPFSCHLAGWFLKRRYPDLPWVVDIGDPFAFLHECPINNHRLYRRLNYWAEAAVLKAADRIAVTAEGARARYLAEFDISAEKIMVIPPLLSVSHSPEAAGARLRPEGRGNRVRLVYCGHLYRSIRNPGPLLALFHRLLTTAPRTTTYELHLYGNLGDCRDLLDPYTGLLDRHLFVHGQVDRSRAVAAMRSADVLVNIGNSTSHQVPSKVIEYMGMGKPILNLVQRDDDCALSFLEAYPMVLNLRCSLDELDRDAERTARFLQQLPPDLSAEEVSAACAPFQPETITDAYVGLSRAA